ncbi:TPA: hypothetical protein JLK75_004820 [Escherichia coli]|nr:hypothetical protein [Escherichia coli]
MIILLMNGGKVVCQRYGVNAGYLSVCIGRLLYMECGVFRLACFYCW